MSAINQLKQRKEELENESIRLEAASKIIAALSEIVQQLAASHALLDRAEDWMTTQAPTAPEVVQWKADRRKAEKG